MWLRSVYITAAAATLSVGVAVMALADPPAAILPAPTPVEQAVGGPLDAGMPILPITPIDLAGALKLAGVENPQILIARQRVQVEVAYRQLAAAQILPTLNVGLNYYMHTGPLQQSSGNILKVNRSDMFVGAGANAVGSGAVNVPGLVYNLNVSNAIFANLIAKQRVEASTFASQAVKNETFRQVALAYTDLLWAAGRRSVAQRTLEEAQEVSRVTSEFARTGLGTQADADRAASEVEQRKTDVVETENQVLIASARLAELLAIDQTLLLHPVEASVVPTPVVPDPIPLQELLAIAVLQRPELAERQAVIRQAMLALSGAKLLPFSPTMIVGFSAGTYGGGSTAVANALHMPAFGNFDARNDLDAVAYWTLQNCGLGNLAMIKAAAANLSQTQLEKLEVFNRVRREVADAYVRTHISYAQIPPTEAAVVIGTRAFREDFDRVKGGVGLPIELLQSLRLLFQARNAYLAAIVSYNEAQIDLYVALGQPPADTLARPVPTTAATLGENPAERAPLNLPVPQGGAMR